MIRLFFDGLTATVKFVDRIFTAAEQNVRRPGGPPPVDDAQPARADPRLGAGGHPIENTSELLTQAATEIQGLGRMAFATRQPWIEAFAAELRDRAANLASHGD